MRKSLVIVLAFVLSSAIVYAQQAAAPAGAASQTEKPAIATPVAKPGDVDTIDHILAAVYDVISGPAGQARDWDRFRSLFIAEARLIPNGIRPDGTITHAVYSVDDYVKRASGAFAQQGFFESETARRLDRYSNIAQAFSTYESRHEKAGAPFARGINSFQLLYDGKRWYVVTILWEGESPSAPIPPEYRKKGE